MTTPAQRQSHWHAEATLFGFPEGCRLLRELPLREFARAAEGLSAAEKSLLQEEVAAACCAFVIDDAHGVRLAPIDEDTRGTATILQVSLSLKRRDRAAAVARMAHRAFPYPVVLTLREEATGALAFSVAPEKRLRQDGKGGALLETPPRLSRWMSSEEQSRLSAYALFAARAPRSARELLDEIADAADALVCAQELDTDRDWLALPRERLRAIAAEADSRAAEVRTLQARGKGETDLRRCAQINVALQEARHALEKLRKS